jgi:hypothetical protein
MIAQTDDSEQPDLVLLPHHVEQLANNSGISRDVITERGYYSIIGVASRNGNNCTLAAHPVSLKPMDWLTDRQKNPNSALC